MRTKIIRAATTITVTVMAIFNVRDKPMNHSMMELKPAPDRMIF